MVTIFVATLKAGATPVANDDVDAVRWISAAEQSSVPWAFRFQQENAEIVFEQLLRNKN
jgi:hypothetical protein